MTRVWAAVQLFQTLPDLLLGKKNTPRPRRLKRWRIKVRAYRVSSGRGHFQEIPETGYFTEKTAFFCSLSWRFRLMSDSGRDVMVGGTVMVGV